MLFQLVHGVAKISRGCIADGIREQNIVRIFEKVEFAAGVSLLIATIYKQPATDFLQEVNLYVTLLYITFKDSTVSHILKLIVSYTINQPNFIPRLHRIFILQRGLSVNKIQEEKHYSIAEGMIVPPFLSESKSGYANNRGVLCLKKHE